MFHVNAPKQSAVSRGIIWGVTSLTGYWPLEQPPWTVFRNIHIGRLIRDRSSRYRLYSITFVPRLLCSPEPSVVWRTSTPLLLAVLLLAWWRGLYVILSILWNQDYRQANRHFVLRRGSVHYSEGWARLWSVGYQEYAFIWLLTR